jgi:hypothetical protein
MEDMDLSPHSREAFLERSERHFEHEGGWTATHQLQPLRHDSPRSQVPNCGWQVELWHFDRLSTRHREIIEFLVSMLERTRKWYASLYGLNWVNRDKVNVVTDSTGLCRLPYRWFEVVD